MAYDLEEQEQIDEFKAWWKQYGKTVSSLVIGLVVAYAAYQIWNYVQHKQAIDASTQFQELTVIDQKDLKAIQAKSAAIMEQYGGTPYAARAALFALKLTTLPKTQQVLKRSWTGQLKMRKRLQRVRWLLCNWRIFSQKKKTMIAH